jgi:hypothetical protein
MPDKIKDRAASLGGDLDDALEHGSLNLLIDQLIHDRYERGHGQWLLATVQLFLGPLLGVDDRDDVAVRGHGDILGGAANRFDP